MRYNSEINILQNEELNRFIKSQGIQWLGHIQRRLRPAVYIFRRLPTRSRGMPKMRWIGKVVDDLRPVRITGQVGQDIKGHTAASKV